MSLHLHFFELMPSGACEGDLVWVLMDLGQTVIRFDWAAPLRRLSEWGVRFRDMDALAGELDFDGLERGVISANDFFGGMRRRWGLRASEKELAEVWSAIFTLWPERQRVLERLATRYQVAAASNTCGVHVDWMRSHSDLLDSFHRCFYSYEMGARKPEAEFYQKILDALKVPAKSCLLVDDRADNVEGARTVGLRAIQVDPEEDLVERLREAGIEI